MIRIYFNSVHEHARQGRTKGVGKSQGGGGGAHRHINILRPKI